MSRMSDREGSWREWIVEVANCEAKRGVLATTMASVCQPEEEDDRADRPSHHALIKSTDRSSSGRFVPLVLLLLLPVLVVSEVVLEAEAAVESAAVSVVEAEGKDDEPVEVLFELEDSSSDEQKGAGGGL